MEKTCTDILTHDNLKLTPLNGIKPITMHKNNCQKGLLRPEHLLINDTSELTPNITTSSDESIFDYSDQLAQPPTEFMLLEDESDNTTPQINPGTEENDEPEPHPTTPPEIPDTEQQTPLPDQGSTGARRKPG